MEIIETIPIYGMPNWIGILFFVSIGLAILAIIINSDTIIVA